MAWVTSVELDLDGRGTRQRTDVVAFVKVIQTPGSDPILQIDTRGSAERENPGKQSQTIQLGRVAAKNLYDILKQTYAF